MGECCLLRLYFLWRWCFALQEILADAVERLAGPNVIENSANVTGFEEIRDPATGVEELCMQGTH